MRQNIYDDEAFFQGYADLRASPGNFNDLVEQPALRALLPPRGRWCWTWAAGRAT